MDHVQFVPSTSSPATLLPRPEEKLKLYIYIYMTALRIVKFYWEGDFSDQQLGQQTR